MSYQATISIQNPQLQQLLETEYKDLKKPRFSVSVNNGMVHIDASDAKALKGIMFSIIHAIETFEKVETMVKK